VPRREGGECPENLKPVGTGPYKLTEFKSGDVVTYEINTNYRDPKKPYFKTVQFKGGGDALSAARASSRPATSTTDGTSRSSPRAQVPDPGKHQGDYLGKASSNVERVNINFAEPRPGSWRQPLRADHKAPVLQWRRRLTVRQALAMATDRATIGDQLYGNGLNGTSTCNQLLGSDAWTSKNTASEKGLQVRPGSRQQAA